MVATATAGPAHGPMPGASSPASSGSASSGMGYARHGFLIKFYLERPKKGQPGREPQAISDPTMLRNMLDYVAWNLRSSGWRSQFMYSPRITQYMPFFRLANYNEEEQTFFRVVHPHAGGSLIRSGHVIPTVNMAESAIIVEFAWATPYFGYLVKHGVSREPGTFVRFWPIVRATNYLQTAVKNLFYQFGTSVSSKITRWVHQSMLGDF